MDPGEPVAHQLKTTKAFNETLIREKKNTLMLLLLQNPTNPTDIFLKLLLSITIKSDTFVVHI